MTTGIVGTLPPLTKKEGSVIEISKKTRGSDFSHKKEGVGKIGGLF